MDYYISDTHFGHENIIRFCDRPFSSADEMDRALVENWNARVGADDHVWHLGDFSYKDGGRAKALLEKLNGRKHLIVGNHDHKSVLKQVEPGDYFETVEYAASRLDDKNRRIWMCHYPLAAPPKHFWMLYGHIHNNKDAGYWDLLRSMDTALNCCVEVNGYMPVTFEELIANNERWRREA